MLTQHLYSYSFADLTEFNLRYILKESSSKLVVQRQEKIQQTKMAEYRI